MFGVIVNPVSGGREAAGLAVQITERIAALGEESRIFETGGDGDAAAQTRAALEEYELPEVAYFLETFMPSFSLTLDQLK